jgi:hypothetical protein
MSNMKNFIIFLCIISLPQFTSGQSGIPFTGDGSFSNPYHGDLYEDFTLNSGTIYIDGDIWIMGCMLTFQEGTTSLISTDVVIYNMGGLILAEGTSAQPVIFTSVAANWGHFGFSYAYGSAFTYCTFENGAFSGDGGAFYLYASDIELVNCTFRNNYASNRGGAISTINGSVANISNCIFDGNIALNNGGAIFLTQGGAVNIDRCRFYSNSASQGGGIYMTSTANNVLIQNSLIYKNSCTGTGGGILGGGSSSLNLQNIVNSAIVDNTPNDITITSANKIRIRNSIVWGSSSNSVYFDYNYIANNLINCAVQKAYTTIEELNIPTVFPTSFKLNALNLAVDGPNFIDPLNNNYSIDFVSPCRDAGTSSGSPVPPSTDFLTNNRIGAYDIGAYEVQYSLWKTTAATTAWETASNWVYDILPSVSNNAVVPANAANFPVISASDVTLSNLIIQSGTVPGSLAVNSPRLMTVTNINNAGTLSFEAGAKGTVSSLVNSGTLNLNSNASGIASLMVDYHVNTGNENVQLYLSGGDAGSGEYRWHYISNPMNSPLNIHSNISPGIETVTLNLARFDEDRYTGSGNTSGWVAWDGYLYSDGSTVTGFDVLDPGKGYDYYHEEDQTYVLSGTLRNGLSDVGLSLDCSAIDSDISGFNLLGNPFSCGLNWDVIANSFDYPANTSKAVFFTRNNVQYTYINGVGVPATANAHIPPMQGFFVKTYDYGNTLTIPVSAREHNLTGRYKGEPEEISLVRLSIEENNKSDETVARFNNYAKSGIDYDFDAVKMSGLSLTPSISLSGNDIDFVINSLPFPDNYVEIPVNVRVGKTANGNHIIKTAQLQGMDNYLVTFTDKQDNISINLKTNPNFTFAAPEGLITNRFVLRIGNISTVSEEIPDQDKAFNIYPANGLINLRTLSDDWNGLKGDIKIRDLTGKTLLLSRGHEFYTSAIIQLPDPGIHGICIVEITSGPKRFSGKIIMK